MRATYGERASAARRASDAIGRQPGPCRKCGYPVPVERMDTLCAGCRPMFRDIAKLNGLDAAESWIRGES